MKRIILILIRIYQKTISLDHGPFSYLVGEGLCRFHPTCSMYTYESIEKSGVMKGLYKGVKRVLRCHPWNAGGHDPVDIAHKTKDNNSL